MHERVVGAVDGEVHVARARPGLIDSFLIGYVEPQRFRPEMSKPTLRHVYLLTARGVFS